ncbi:MAG: formyltransferase family protein [Bacteroidota bacterium]
MRVVILCGSNPNQKALANKIAKQFDVVGLVIEKRVGKNKKQSFSKILKKIWDRTRFHKIDGVWKKMMRHYEEFYSQFPNTSETLVTPNVNDKSVYDFVGNCDPDLVVVSGTRIIKPPFFDLKPSKGITNLHTGISPYIKGGPNCTNWCLAEDQFHLIGNTIMWIDAGIDSGNIITTEQTSITGEENLFELHIKVMEHAHDLYLRSLHTIEYQFDDCPSVPQKDIDKGNLYYNRMWTASKKRSLLNNTKGSRFKQRVQSNEYKENTKALHLISLPN